MDDASDFDAYWLRFVRDHRQPGTQWAHLFGNALGVSTLVAAPFTWPLLILAAPLPVLLASRLSHSLIERNVPLKASENPLFFLRCELKMGKHLLTGTMPAELQRASAPT